VKLEIGIFRTRGPISAVCLLALATIGVMAVSPSSAASRPGRPSGDITGVFESVGGPAPGSPRPLPGVVELTSESGKHIFFKAGKNGSVKGRIAAGTYSAAGRSPKMEQNVMICRGESPVVVRPGHHTHFIVTCDVP
jgi:hypothetical protein